MSLKYKVLIATAILLFLTTSYCAVQTIKNQRNDTDISYQLIKDKCEPSDAHFVPLLGSAYALFELDDCLSYNNLIMVTWAEETSVHKELLAQACVSQLVYERNRAKKENLTYKLIKLDKDKLFPPEGESGEPLDLFIAIYELQESK